MPRTTPAQPRKISRSSDNRRHAADLAVELERQLGDPGRIPRNFVDSSLPAGLTLVARLAIPETDVPGQVFTPGPAGLADRPIEDVLDDLRSGPLKGAAELLDGVRN